MKNNASLVYNFCLVIGDVIALILAFGGAYFIRAHLYHTPVANPVHVATYLAVLAALLPFWIVLFALMGLYNSSIYEKRFSELGRLLIASFIGMLFVVFWNYLSLKPILPSKLVPIYGLVLAFVLLAFLRNLARLIRTELFTYQIGLNRVLLVGNSAVSSELVDLLYNSRESGYQVAGVVGNKQVLGTHQDIPHFSAFMEALKSLRQPVQTIVQTELYADENRNREVLEYAQIHHIAYRFVPGNTELFVGNLDVELFRNSLPVISVHQTALVGWGRVVKRLFDFFIALILIIITSPFMLLIAASELLTGEKIFFRQVRLTRFNQKFKVFKFRTQYQKYDGTTPEEAFKLMGRAELIEPYRKNGDFLANDPRTTKLGRFLKRTSLDELPQLFNILRGDISLVGPRSLIPQEISLYEKHYAILSVKSGLTGLAQVSGRKNISFAERRKLDLYYVQNWSFGMDLIILAKTIRVILKGS